MGGGISGPDVTSDEPSIFKRGGVRSGLLPARLVATHARAAAQHDPTRGAGPLLSAAGIEDGHTRPDDLTGRPRPLET